jgi:hypothetical protein
MGYLIFEEMCRGLTVLNRYKVCPAFIQTKDRPLIIDVITADNFVWL